MKILFIHNKYGVTSGEEVMLMKIVRLLEQNGHDVRCFFKDSADIEHMRMGKIRSFFSGIYSVASRDEIRHELIEFKPDIVQIQNLFPLISPSILPVIKSFHIPVVMRVSNYRLMCPSGLFLSHGIVCEKCRNGREFWCVFKNCEKSFFKSLGYAVRNWVARKMRFYLNNVTCYYAQTEFQKNCLVEEGFSSGEISVIPNMADGVNEGVNSDLGHYIGYAGRISQEKGVSTLLDSAEICSDIPFKLAGDFQKMPDLASHPMSNIELLGHLDKEALNHFYSKCLIFVMPTIWYEGFPNVLLEAMLHVKPVICSNIGGLPEIVEDGKTGLLFEPGDSKDLAEKIRYLYTRPELCREMGQSGRKKVLDEYSPARYYEKLMAVYNKAKGLV